MARLVLLLVVVTAGLLAMLLAGQGGAKTAGGDARRAAVPDADAGERPVAASKRPAGTLVFVSRSNRLVAIDVASGHRTVRRVGSLAACGPELYITGGHVIFAGVQKRRTVVFSVPISLDRPPRRLGGAHAFVPSATEGRVWLAGVDCSREAMAGVREMTVDGRVTLASRRRVPGSWLAGAVHGGLVIQRGHALFVWDPSTGRTGRRLSLEAVTETRGDLLIGCEERSDCRDLVILDADTTREVVARPGHRYRLELAAAFSPDGSQLATPARTGRRWSVALVDSRNGANSIVPGSRTGSAFPELSWAASSGWLFFRARAGRIMAYRPGVPRAVTLPFRAPRQATAFVAG